MALFWSDRGAQRAPSLKGRVIFDVYRGQIRARAWPSKKTQPRPQRNLQQEEWFRQANLIDRYAAPADRAVRRRVTQGTVFMPRDLLLKALRGYLIEPVDQAGNIYRSAAVREQVTEALDYLSDKPGDIAVRTEEGWRATPKPLVLPPPEVLDGITEEFGAILFRGVSGWTHIPAGNDGQVLQWQNALGAPGWIDAEFGGGGGTQLPTGIGGQILAWSEANAAPYWANPENVIDLGLPAEEPPVVGAPINAGAFTLRFIKDALAFTENPDTSLRVSFATTTIDVDYVGALRPAPAPKWRVGILFNTSEVPTRSGLLLRNSTTGDAIVHSVSDDFFSPHWINLLSPNGTPVDDTEWTDRGADLPWALVYEIYDTETKVFSGSSFNDTDLIQTFTHDQWLGKADQAGVAMRANYNPDPNQYLDIISFYTEIIE